MKASAGRKSRPSGFAIGGVSVCRWHECRGCEAATRTTAHASAQWLNACRSDVVAMTALRRVLASEMQQPDLSSMNDDDVIKQVDTLFQGRQLRVCKARASSPTTDHRDEGISALADVLRVLSSSRKPFTYQGRLHEVISARRWYDVRDGGRYQVVPTNEARKILDVLKATPGTALPVQNALSQAAGLLATTGAGRYESGLLLLRVVPARTFINASADPPITPSQLAKLIEKHWVGIEVLDEDGNGLSNIAYSIVTPDNQTYTGTTDSNGLARIDNIPPGQCQISFPELDKDSYKAA